MMLVATLFLSSSALTAAGGNGDCFSVSQSSGEPVELCARRIGITPLRFFDVQTETCSMKLTVRADGTVRSASVKGGNASRETRMACRQSARKWSFNVDGLEQGTVNVGASVTFERVRVRNQQVGTGTVKTTVRFSDI